LPERGEWDLEQGTIALHIKKEAFTKNAPMYFEQKSKDGKAAVRFLKDKRNNIRFEYENDEIGTVFRQKKVMEQDIHQWDLTWPNGQVEPFNGIFVAFRWNIKNGQTDLLLNPGHQKKK